MATTYTIYYKLSHHHGNNIHYKLSHHHGNNIHYTPYGVRLPLCERLTFSGVSVAIMVGLSGLRPRVWGWLANMPGWLGDPAIFTPGWLGDPAIFSCPPSNVPTGLRRCGDALGTPLSIGSFRTLKEVRFPPCPTIFGPPRPNMPVCCAGALREGKSGPCDERYWETCLFCTVDTW